MNSLKVLFVDGDTRVQQSLTRIAKSRKLPLELSHASSGREAEAFLARNECDVVVADSRLPDGNGRELLLKVRNSWPMTLRILLTDEDTGGMLSSLLAAAHQLLSKPISPEFLLASVHSSSQLRFLLMNERLRRVLHHMEHLPVLPRVFAELSSELQRENCSSQSLARIIAEDMSLTTGVLKVVNSSYFGLPYRVNEPLQAVNILGGNLLRGLVLSDRVFKTLDPDMYPGFDTEKLWIHCLDAARCCRMVMKGEGGSGIAVEDAFLGGLLHDIGKIVLSEGCPEDYITILMQAQSSNVPLYMVEEEVLGVTHAQVGAYLLGLWGFSEALVTAVAQHHGMLAGSPASELSAVIHAVDVALHDRYTAASGHAPHLPLTSLLGPLAETFPRWKEIVDAEFEIRR